MLTPEEINNIKEIVETAIVEKATPFYEHPEFYFGIILGVAGIILSIFGLKYSIKSFKEAEKAKNEATKASDAAQKAGKTIRKQDIIVILTEMLNECQLSRNIQYFEASSKHRLIHRRISNIRGLYCRDLTPEQIKFLEQIENNIDSIRSTIDLYNYTISGNNSVNQSEDHLCFSLEPIMTGLAGNIELFKGTLQESLI